MPRTDAERRTSAVAVAEGAYPTPHHLEQAAGDGVVQILAREADLTSLDGQPVGLPQVTHELHRVERVAGGLVVQLGQHVRAGLLVGAV